MGALSSILQMRKLRHWPKTIQLLRQPVGDSSQIRRLLPFTVSAVTLFYSVCVQVTGFPLFLYDSAFVLSPS